MEELASKIDQLKKRIEELTSDYRKKSQILSADIDDFNRRAAEGYYDNRLDFDENRDVLVKRQKSLNQDYKALSSLINETNEYINKYNQNVARSSELYRSINSNVEEIASPTN